MTHSTQALDLRARHRKHVEAAERLLAEAEDPYTAGYNERVDRRIRQAQAHATLALALRG